MIMWRMSADWLTCNERYGAAAGEKQTLYPQTVSTFYLIWKGMLVCLKKDMRAFKLAMSPPVCTFSAHRLQHIHTLKPRDHQCTSPSYEIFLCGLGKSHVDHFTQSWTLDSNQSLSLVIMHFQTTAIKIISLNGRNSQSKNRLTFFVITSLIRGRNSSGGKRCRDKTRLGWEGDGD